MLAHPVTRCPHCKAVYRVTPDQLAQAQGWFRCAQCQEVFDGAGLAVSWAPALFADAEDVGAQAPRVDLKALLQKEDRSAPAADTAGDALASFEQALASFPGRRQEPVFDPLDVSPASVAVPPVSSLPARSQAVKRSAWTVVALCALSLLLLLQWVWAVRAWWWQTPWVAEFAHVLCAQVGCTLPATHAPDLLRIDSSRLLRGEQGHRLEWAVRNRSVWPAHMPSMELVLTGSDEAVLVRQTFDPAQMRAPTRLAAGQVWAGSLVLQVQEDLPVSAYRLRVFYP
jgi:predicted Zn finger-like uncharacterized protein